MERIYLMAWRVAHLTAKLLLCTVTSSTKITYELLKQFLTKICLIHWRKR